MWNPKYLAMWPVIAAASCLPHGKDGIDEKMKKRAVMAFAMLMGGVVGWWATGFTGYGLIIIGVQLLLGIATVGLAVMNPYKNAPLEQYLIYQLYTLTNVFWGFIK